MTDDRHLPANARLELRLPAPLAADLRSLAAREDRSISAELRRLIRRRLEEARNAA